MTEETNRVLLGKHIGAFKITAQLGAGGMGEVYRAEDMRLGRTVAVKVLAGELAQDSERLRRFVREARAASSLNHPNVAHIYEIGQSDGLHFIAMEYVEGQSLAQRMSGRPLDLREVLDIGIQTADALEEAHQKGVTHRDIKSANLMLTPKGQVKVLDFGLAKMTRPEGEVVGSDVSTSIHTTQGKVIGTLHYMSPEQVLGKELDGRTDLFSLGVVLYEMTTGRLPFSGAQVGEVTDKILHAQPEALARFNYDVPAELERIIRKCLEKDRERRYQSAREVRADLSNLKEEIAANHGLTEGKRRADSQNQAQRRKMTFGLEAPSETVATALRIQAKKRFAVFVSTSVLLAVAAAAAVWWWSSRKGSETHEPLKLTRLTSDSGFTTDGVISPDAKFVAYASDRSGEENLDIWVRHAAGGEPIRLTRDLADDSQPDFSPDGSQIVFRSERDGGGIYLTSTLGGVRERLLAPRGRNPRFSPDGSRIAYWTGSVYWESHLGAQASEGSLFVMSTSGGAPISALSGFVSAGCPIWSPDGKYLLFYGNLESLTTTATDSDWWVVSREGGKPVRTGALDALAAQQIERRFPSLVPLATQWIGNFIFFYARLGDSVNLWRVPISSGSWQVAGSAQRLTSGSGLEIRPSLSKDGTLVFSSLSENSDLWCLPLDTDRGKPAARLQQLSEGNAAEYSPSISADGKTVAFVSDRSGNPDIWMKNLDTGQETPLTATEASEAHPEISRDGSQVAYSSVREAASPSNMEMQIVPTLGGVAEIVCQGCGYAWDFTSDNRRLAFSQSQQIDLLDIPTKRKISLLKPSGSVIWQAKFSPDGHWISFGESLSEGGRSRLFVAPFQSEGEIPKEKLIALTDGSSWDDKPRWSPDGNLVYFTSERDGFTCLWAQQLDPSSKRPKEAPFPVYHFHQARRSLGRAGYHSLEISVARDKIVFNLVELTGNVWMTKVDLKHL